MSKSICEHIEASLPQELDGDFPRLIESERAANHTLSIWQILFPQFDAKEFRDEMVSYGFTSEWDLELLTARYVDGYSVREIEKRFNWVSKSTVHRRLNALHKELVRRGYTKGIK